MQYLYHPDAAQTEIALTGESHRYLFKVRRHRAGESVYLRNLRDERLYSYLIETMDRRNALLRLQEGRVVEVKAARSLHLGWCMIDPKNIEKLLPSLNEAGVERITFIYCHRSQKSFKLDFRRLEKILLNSSQQCGRSVMMHLEVMESLAQFKERYPEAVMLHFSPNPLLSSCRATEVVIGCEGGFSEEEVTLFAPEALRGLQSPLILRSESAAMAVASKLLL